MGTERDNESSNKLLDGRITCTESGYKLNRWDGNMPSKTICESAVGAFHGMPVGSRLIPNRSKAKESYLLSDKSSASSGSLGGTIIFTALLVLKLTHYIDWSWWWITAPLWIPLAVILAIFAVGLVVAAF